MNQSDRQLDIPSDYAGRFKYKKSYNRIAGQNEENDPLSELAKNEVSFSALVI